MSIISLTLFISSFLLAAEKPKTFILPDGLIPTVLYDPEDPLGPKDAVSLRAILNEACFYLARADQEPVVYRELFSSLFKVINDVQKNRPQWSGQVLSEIGSCGRRLEQFPTRDLLVGLARSDSSLAEVLAKNPRLQHSWKWLTEKERPQQQKATPAGVPKKIKAVLPNTQPQTPLESAARIQKAFDQDPERNSQPVLRINPRDQNFPIVRHSRDPSTLAQDGERKSNQSGNPDLDARLRGHDEKGTDLRPTVRFGEVLPRDKNSCYEGQNCVFDPDEVEGNRGEPDALTIEGRSFAQADNACARDYLAAPTDITPKRAKALKKQYLKCIGAWKEKPKKQRVAAQDLGKKIREEFDRTQQCPKNFKDIDLLKRLTAEAKSKGLKHVDISALIASPKDPNSSGFDPHLPIACGYNSGRKMWYSASFHCKSPEVCYGQGAASLRHTCGLFSRGRNGVWIQQGQDCLGTYSYRRKDEKTGYSIGANGDIVLIPLGEGVFLNVFQDDQEEFYNGLIIVPSAKQAVKLASLSK